MQAEQQSERERFETWAKDRGHPLCDVIPKYGPTSSMPQTEIRFSDIAFEAWQARAALSHPSTPQGWQCPKCGIERHGPLIACMQDGCPPPEQGGKG